MKRVGQNAFSFPGGGGPSIGMRDRNYGYPNAMPVAGKHLAGRYRLLVGNGSLARLRCRRLLGAAALIPVVASGRTFLRLWGQLPSTSRRSPMLTPVANTAAANSTHRPPRPDADIPRPAEDRDEVPFDLPHIAGALKAMDSCRDRRCGLPTPVRGEIRLRSAVGMRVLPGAQPCDLLRMGHCDG